MSEKKAEAMAPSIPVTWKSGNTTLPAKSKIVLPTAQEVGTFSDVRIQTCGGCQYFQHRHGQTVVDKFMAMVLYDAKWKKEFVSEDPSKLGRCAQNADLMTGPNSRSCDHWRAK